MKPSQAQSSRGAGAQLRPADFVMSPARVAAAFPNAMSFTRTMYDELFRGGWKLQKLRVDLDANGCGEVIYKLTDGKSHLLFMIISNNFSDGQKTDRSYNMNWDASGALCQGEWSPEREAYMRREIPKQRFGRLDYDTLAYTRGNRSERIFDHVVESLTRGEQPDARRLAEVGYIFRTTGFTANGFIGMRSFAGLGEGHPLRRPYHVQMCTAFLLREYVFDLVDCMAAARSDKAVRLDPAYRRYLGIGNSAGLGLVPFIYNHPHMVHRWTWAKESALADAKARNVAAGSQELDRFRILLAKARRYFTEDPRDGNGIFADYIQIAQQLGDVQRWVEGSAFRDGGAELDFWPRLLDWAESELHPETAEVLNTILLEIYPDIVAHYSDLLVVDETLDIDPSLTLGGLRRLIDSCYGWAKEFGREVAARPDLFWYMSTEAPYEPRRGYRGLIPDYELETHMDAPLRFHELAEAMAGLPNDYSLAAFLAEHPRFRNVAARLCSLADKEYAELRENTLHKDHRTFGAVRFMLSYYGMDKLDPRPPRSVKGAMLQGAPISEDLETGNPGEWPFPLIPQQDIEAERARSSAYAPLRHLEAPELRADRLEKIQVWHETIHDETLTASSMELQRWGQRSLEASHVPLGIAVSMTKAVQFAEGLWNLGIRTVLRHRQAGLLGAYAAKVQQQGRATYTLLDARSSLLAAPSMLDLACFAASQAESGIGSAQTDGLEGLSVLERLPLWAAERGYLCLMIWSAQEEAETEPLGPLRLVASAPDQAGPWYIGVSLNALPAGWLGYDQELAVSSDIGMLLQHATSVGDSASSQAAGIEQGKSRLRVICIDPKKQPSLPAELQAALRRIAERTEAHHTVDFNAETLIQTVDGWQRNGIPVLRDELEAIKELGFGTLLPAQIETPVRTDL